MTEPIVIQSQRFLSALTFDTPDPTDEDIEEHLNQLRILILKYGIPDVKMKHKDVSIRERVWKCLLRIGNADVGEYLSLVEKGKSPMYDDIKRDSIRTLKKCSVGSAVSQDQLERVLNAFVHYHRLKSMDVAQYVQGMCMVAIPLLCVLPEPDAFFAFVRLITKHCPMYFRKNLEGIHAGTVIIDDFMGEVDRQLLKHLKSHSVRSNVWAFSNILSFFTLASKWDETLQMWDFFLAFGMHLIIPSVLAHALLIRKDVLASTAPIRLLEDIQSFQAKKLIEKVRDIMKRISESQHSLLLLHMVDSEVVSELVPEHLKGK
ncbi:hypothetical protein ADUPG1_013631 [Aduncisulcus paluster]|uniref:Rab-GAP TBC domain-containing protein n=1 Tax=Aduncisulcus paluster TaxID=2918883 RepID=A0ABQ5K3K3_9EUKA|nr:hypothetical protein ADUPG1_013631 [Aduncisulcus paluster]